jgi:hypothetical protein
VAAGQSVRDVSRCLGPQSPITRTQSFFRPESTAARTSFTIGRQLAIRKDPCVDRCTDVCWYGYVYCSNLSIGMVCLMVSGGGRLDRSILQKMRSMRVICTCAGSTRDISSAVVARTTNRDCRQISARYAISLTRFEYCGLHRCVSSTGLRWRGIGDLSDHLRKLALSRVLFRSERRCATPPEQKWKPCKRSSGAHRRLKSGASKICR